MNVTIYGPNLPRNLESRGTMVVHRAGCADTARGAYARLAPSQCWTIQADTAEDIIEAVYGDFEDYPDDPATDAEAYSPYRTDVYLFPCVDLPEHAA